MRPLVVTAISLFSLTALASPLEDRADADASASRGILIPTAETIGEGKLTVTDFEILFVNATYGVSDDLQVGVTTILPLFASMPTFGIFSGKLKVQESDTYQISVQPSALVLGDSGVYGGTIGVQAMADIVLDSEGSWVLSLSENNMFAWGDGELISEGFAFTLGASLQGQISSKIKLLCELFTPGVVPFEGDAELFGEAAGFGYGVRFFGEGLSGDITFLRPLDSDMAGALLLGLPLLSVTARF